MGIIDQYLAAATTFTAWATESLASTKEDWPSVGMRVDSDADTVDMPFVQDLPLLRQWVGDKHILSMKENHVSVKAPDWESTIGIPMRALQTNQLGHYKAMIQTYPQLATVDRDSRFWAKLETGFATNGYDSVNFIGNTHPLADGTTQSNLVPTNYQLNATSYGAAVKLLRGMKSWNGRALNLQPTTLVVAPDLEATAKTILNAQLVSSGNSNIWQGSAELLVRADLTAKHWFLFCNSFALRAMGMVVRNGNPVFVPADGMLDYARFMRNEAMFSVECSHEAFFGLYHLVVGSTGAGAAP